MVSTKPARTALVTVLLTPHDDLAMVLERFQKGLEMGWGGCKKQNNSYYLTPILAVDNFSKTVSIEQRWKRVSRGQLNPWHQQ